MASPVEQNLAKSVLNDLRGAKATPQSDRAAQAARKILDGIGTKADMDTVRQFAGVKRSGAGFIRGVTSNVRSVFSPVSRVAYAVELQNAASQSGKSSATANALLTKTIFDEVERGF